MPVIGYLRTPAIPEKRYQVFVSSTYRDLQDERRQVIQSLLELDCIPSGMEMFPAANEDQWTVIKRVIDDCDYYMVIIAARYGSTDAEGVSYTEKEYDYAVSQGKPVIAFVHSEPGKIAADDAEATLEGKRRLDAFREKVRKRMCKEWRDAATLGTAVTTSLVKLMKTNPAEGWMRARYAADPELAARSTALQTRVSELQAEVKRLRTSAPEGTEGLARGSSECVLHFRGSAGGQYADLNDEVRTTWDGLFALVGPVMFDDVDQRDLHRYVNGSLRYILKNRAPPEQFMLYVHDPDFQRAKIQFAALGLIEKGEPYIEEGRRHTTWHLTPYGVSYLTRLLAVKGESAK